METKYLSLIIIAALFLFFILLFAILSFKYYQKHEPYRKLRDDYLASYHQLKAEAKPVSDLVVLETEINLPEDENFYLIKNQLNYYEQNVKPQKKGSAKNRLLIKEYEADYDFIEQKNNYSLNNRAEKYYRENLTADLLVTNKRILLKDGKKIEEINFNKIEKVAPILMTVKKNNFLGIIIYTKEKLYKIKDDDLNDVLIIETLLTNSREEQAND